MDKEKSDCVLLSVRVTMVSIQGRNVMETALDENGNQVVILPDIIFAGKQKIDWYFVKEIC